MYRRKGLASRRSKGFLVKFAVIFIFLWVVGTFLVLLSLESKSKKPNVHSLKRAFNALAKKISFVANDNVGPKVSDSSDEFLGKGTVIFMDWPFNYKLFSSVNYLCFESLLAAYPFAKFRILSAPSVTAGGFKMFTSSNQFITYSRRSYDIEHHLFLDAFKVLNSSFGTSYYKKWATFLCISNNSSHNNCKSSSFSDIPFHFLSYARLNQIWSTGGMYSDFSYLPTGSMLSAHMKQAFFFNSFLKPIDRAKPWGRTRKHYTATTSELASISASGTQTTFTEGRNRSDRAIDVVGVADSVLPVTSTLWVFPQRHHPAVACTLSAYDDSSFLACIDKNDNVFGGAKCVERAMSNCFEKLSIRNFFDRKSEILSKLRASSSDGNSGVDGGDLVELFDNDPAKAKDEMLSNDWKVSVSRKRGFWLGELAYSGQWFETSPHHSASAHGPTTLLQTVSDAVVLQGASFISHYRRHEDEKAALTTSANVRLRLRGTNINNSSRYSILSSSSARAVSTGRKYIRNYTSCVALSQRLVKSHSTYTEKPPAFVLSGSHRSSYRTGIESASAAPGFIVAGFQSAGSSLLLNAILKHPQVLPPIRTDGGDHTASTSSSQSLGVGGFTHESHCYNTYADASPRRLMKRPWCYPFIHPHRDPVISADSVASYATRQRSLPNVLKADNPNVKIVFIVRNPLEMLYSSYLKLMALSSVGSVTDTTGTSTLSAPPTLPPSSPRLRHVSVSSAIANISAAIRSVISLPQQQRANNNRSFSAAHSGKKGDTNYTFPHKHLERRNATSIDVSVNLGAAFSASIEQLVGSGASFRIRPGENSNTSDSSTASISRLSSSSNSNGSMSNYKNYSANTAEPSAMHSHGDKGIDRQRRLLSLRGYNSNKNPMAPVDVSLSTLAFDDWAEMCLRRSEKFGVLRDLLTNKTHDTKSLIDVYFTEASAIHVATAATTTTSTTMASGSAINEVGTRRALYVVPDHVDRKNGLQKYLFDSDNSGSSTGSAERRSLGDTSGQDATVAPSKVQSRDSRPLPRAEKESFFSSPLGKVFDEILMESLSYLLILHFIEVLGKDNIMVVNGENLDGLLDFSQSSESSEYSSVNRSFSSLTGSLLDESMDRFLDSVQQIYSFVGLCSVDIDEHEYVSVAKAYAALASEPDVFHPLRSIFNIAKKTETPAVSSQQQNDISVVSQEMYRRLQKFFEPFVSALMDVSGLELSHWVSPDSVPGFLPPLNPRTKKSHPKSWFDHPVYGTTKSIEADDDDNVRRGWLSRIRNGALKKDSFISKLLSRRSSENDEEGAGLMNNEEEGSAYNTTLGMFNMF